MRETLATSAVLVRYGLRSAWGSFASKQHSLAIRMLALFSWGFWPFLYFYNNSRVLQHLANSDSLKKMISEWNLPPEALGGSSTLWPELPELFGMGLCAMILALFIGGIFAVYLMGQRKGIDTEMEWFQTFPNPLRSILWGRLLQSTVIQPYIYLFILPFLLSLVIVRGHNLAISLLAATLLSWLGMLAASSLGMILHYVTKFHLSPKRQRDLQFLFVLLLIASFIGIYLPFYMAEGAYWRGILQIAPFIPETGFPQLMTLLLSGEAASLLPLLILLGTILVWAQVSVVISEKIVAGRLPAQEGAGKKEGRFLAFVLDSLSPVMRRELRVLMRDRSQWISCLSGPLFVLAFMMWNNFGNQDPMQGKHLLFLCLMMYLIMSGLIYQVLFQRERPSLWFYAASPLRLSEVLREQTKLPSLLFGLMYAVAFAIFVPHDFWQDAESLLSMALGLTFVFAVQRHYRNLALLSYVPASEMTAGKPLQLSSWFASAPLFLMIIFQADPWNVAAFLTFFAALVFSYEKKVRAREDELIDPTFPIPRKADLPQGFLTAFLYVLALLAVKGVALLFDFNLSVEFLAAAATLLALHYYSSSREVQDLPVYFGAVRILDLLFLVLAGNFILQAAGMWDRLTSASTFLERLYDLRIHPAAPATAVMLFITLARSVTEEYIFRGLIQRGLASRLAWPWTVIISAGLTTLCHKPQDFGPILLTSIGSGLLYHRTKVLWPGIVLALAIQSLRIFGY